MLRARRTAAGRAPPCRRQRPSARFLLSYRPCLAIAGVPLLTGGTMTNASPSIRPSGRSHTPPRALMVSTSSTSHRVAGSAHARAPVAIAASRGAARTPARRARALRSQLCQLPGGFLPAFPVRTAAAGVDLAPEVQGLVVHRCPERRAGETGSGLARSGAEMATFAILGLFTPHSLAVRLSSQ